METAWPLLMFLAGLIGTVMLILICGVQSREMERAEAAEAVPVPVPERSFIATLSAAFEVPPAMDEVVIRNVERHLRRQVEVAGRFVDCPSIQAFHDVPDTALRTELSLFSRIQTFLQRERELAYAFVGDPTLDRLHGELGPVSF